MNRRDALLAGALLVLCLADVLASAPGVRAMDWLGYGLTVLCCVPVAGRRRWPVAALAVCAAAFAGYLALSYAFGWLMLPVMVLMYTVARRGGRRAVLAGALVLTLAGAAAWQLPGGWPAGRPGVLVYGLYLATWLALFAGAALVGEVVRYRAESLRARAEATRLEVARGVAEERLRLARELHDVIGHSMASIAVQSAAALRVLGDGESPAREALVAIRATSRDAVTELRGTLGALRDGPDPAHPVEPATGMDRLPALLESVRAAGLPVELLTDGAPAPLPPDVDHAAYRIAQEALTNVLRHAGPAATATVRVGYRGDAVRLTVTDTGTGGTPGPGGHGLVGMRERAGAVGGTLVAGPAEPPAVGFEVRAVLPVPGGEAA